MKFKLPYKIALFSLLISTAGVFSLSFFTFNKADQLLQKQAMDDLSYSILNKQLQVESFFKIIDKDIAFLPHSGPIKKIVSISDKGRKKKPPAQASPSPQKPGLDFWKKRVEGLFRALLEQRPQYTQIYFFPINKSGKHAIGMGRKAGTISPLSKEEINHNNCQSIQKEEHNWQPGRSFFSKISQPPEPSFKGVFNILCHRTLVLV